MASRPCCSSSESDFRFSTLSPGFPSIMLSSSFLSFDPATATPFPPLRALAVLPDFVFIIVGSEFGLRLSRVHPLCSSHRTQLLNPNLEPSIQRTRSAYYLLLPRTLPTLSLSPLQPFPTLYVSTSVRFRVRFLPASEREWFATPEGNNRSSLESIV